MNKLFSLLGLTFILMTLTACGPVAQVAQAAILPTASTQPTTIQDPILLEGWSRLNSLTEPVQLWDGRTTSGHELAQFVLEHRIPIIWNTQNVCGGNSCSKRYCQQDGICSHQNDNLPGIEPIYIRTGLPDPSKQAENLNELVSDLAHEIFHYTEPYGPVDDTLYEEYNAYYVDAQVSRQMWTKFQEYNPLQPACLIKWFSDTHLLDGYQNQGMKAYPAAVVPTVDTSSATCQPNGSHVEQASLTKSPTCSLSQDGGVSCQFPPAPVPTPEYQVVCQKDSNGLVGCKTVWLKDVITPQATPSVP